MKILVTTPGGNIGRQIIPELLSPEFSVRVITENLAALPQEIRDQIDVVCGSAADPATLLGALDDVESLFWCIPAAAQEQKDIPGHYERFARTLCGAVRQAGTPRIVTISAAGRELARHAGPISGLHAMEEILNESGAAIRHLRCGLFMESLLPQARSILNEGAFSFPMEGHVPIPMVAAHDAADVALRWLVREDWNGIESVVVPGPERLSFYQVAVVLQEVLGRPVQYREAPANQYIQSLNAIGASVEYARGMVQMFAELAKGVDITEERIASSGVTTKLASWVEKELVPLMRRPAVASE
jgi:uncharacterized protein YbjT (DUF2867 family)